ncbi:hypothetical protein LEP1GSC050_3939 [Leptospira broomii serovar Hurstbridge str. 5399]|uniref:Uncharacterized protein n=1 Tax=Leptospira broomii serovar Hurstbridge str. 5399 TaxID=1049789 RepID=T0GGF3_9LEPT|nr:hypothetical protein [Leptospira broomii]EQA44478.1 hypothetical protein LEP1GSC050_3939 [Leptospira broomii serovar Hurstbridge str. 5399]
MYFRFSEYILCASVLFFVYVLPVFSITYEDAYSLEKESPVFAIPLYEEVAKTASNSDVRKTASTRLYFLYEKFNKYIPALQYQIRAGTIKNKKGEWSGFVQGLAQGLGVSPYALIGITHSCAKSTRQFAPVEQTTVSDAAVNPPQSIPEPYRSLSKKENLPLVRLCYSLKMKTRDYEGWDHVFAYLVERGLLTKDAALPLWVGSALQSGKGTPYRRIFLSGRSKSLSVDSKSDILYLYAKFLRNRGRLEASARYFLMSSSYGNVRRGKLESAKNLLLMDRKKEACSFPSDTYTGGEEAELLFRKICQMSSTDWISSYLPALKILIKENPDPVFAYAIHGGGREGAEYFLSLMNTGISDRDDDGEEETEFNEILSKLLPDEEKNHLPFWDIRDREANLLLSDRTKYICKVIRRPFFGPVSIQPQFCKEVLPGNLDTILASVNEEEEDASYAFADLGYLPVNAKWIWKNFPISDGSNPLDVTSSTPVAGPLSILGPWNLDYIVYRKILKRTYAEIRKGNEYYIISVKPSSILWEKQ